MRPGKPTDTAKQIAWLRLKGFLWQSLALMAFWATLTPLLLIFLSISPPLDFQLTVVLWCMSGLLMTGMINLIDTVATINGKDPEGRSVQQLYEVHCSYATFALVHVNPVTFYFRWVPVGLYRAGAYICPFVWLFTKKLFVMIHSDERLLCGTDAFIGTGIGFLSHLYFDAGALPATIVGALAGGLIGVVNFELVSKRALKLVPRT